MEVAECTGSSEPILMGSWMGIGQCQCWGSAPTPRFQLTWWWSCRPRCGPGRR